MNTPPNNVMVLPPRPPAPLNTVMMASAALILSITMRLTYTFMFAFPSGAVVESIQAWLASFAMCALSFVFGITAMVNETKRSQFKHVVERYTKITGDKRYMPYILPVRTKIVIPLFVLTALCLASFVFTLMGGI